VANERGLDILWLGVRRTQGVPLAALAVLEAAAIWRKKKREQKKKKK
jgi:hypothetical protein